MTEAAASSPGVDPEMIGHEFAEVNEVRIHYAISRPSAGVASELTGEVKLIVFLHGFPEFWYAWRKQLAEFGRDFIAVAPDMRGYNLSSKPAAVEEYTVRKLVGDVRGLVDHLSTAHRVKDRKCFLVGHDWGGLVAWAVAIQCPEIVEKLVIINAPHPKVFERELQENPKQQEASQYMLVFRSPQAEAILSADGFATMQETILGEGIRQGYVTETDRKAYVKAWSQPGALTGGLNYYRAAEAGPAMRPGGRVFNSKDEIASHDVEVPTLVIWGEDDPYLLTGNLDGLERYVPKLEVERIPDATHWVVHEKPSLVNELIREFVTK